MFNWLVGSPNKEKEEQEQEEPVSSLPKPNFFAAIDLTGDNTAVVSSQETVNFFKTEGFVKGYKTKFSDGKTFTPNKVHLLSRVFISRIICSQINSKAASSR